MKLEARGKVFLGIATLVVLVVYFSLARLHAESSTQKTSPPPGGKAKARLKNNDDGLYTIAFESLLYGNIYAYLPDDTAAGDKISGTVDVEPYGATEEERARNRAALNDFAVELEKPKQGGQEGASLSSVSLSASNKFVLTIPVASGKKAASGDIHVVLKSKDGQELGRVSVPLPPSVANAMRAATPTPNDFQLPTIGQEGRPAEIIGLFDGDASNTLLYVNNEQLQKLAESPRKLIFRVPTKIAGATKISLREGAVEVSGTLRVVVVTPSVGKLNLKSGESTTLTVATTGLEGIESDALLLLHATGVVQMTGGNTQVIPIRPMDVVSGGRFVFTRTLTARTEGSFGVVSTVIGRPFNVCLQDDKSGDALFLSSSTGAYAFTQADGANGRGTGEIAKNDCEITLTHNASERKVKATIDMCRKIGKASVEAASPKTKFDIDDKNTTDSRCAAAK
ncbi:MAG TPA: hypothetical protein VF666_03710 [Pyrinomonadaceae bacterium]|jgi:hypothetical protein